MPNFEVFDARIASALNKIIHNSHFKRRISLEEQKAQKAGPFPSWKTDRSPDLRVLPGHCNPTILSRTMPTYSLLVFENDDIQEFDFKVGRNFIIDDENPT